MKFQRIFYTTALSIAVAAGSGAAFAQNDEEALDPVDRHGGLEVEITEVERQKKEAAAKGQQKADEAKAAAHDKKSEATEMNHNKVDSMRETATDEELPNAASRAVPGAPNAGKNPDIDPVAGEADYITEDDDNAEQ